MSNRIAITFGRFNPPTSGHEKVVKVLMSQGCDHILFPSPTCDRKSNPLQFGEKVVFLKSIFPDTDIHSDPSVRNILQAAAATFAAGYRNLVVVVGSDRVDEIRNRLEKYNGVKMTKDGYYNFESIQIISAGERDPDSVDSIESVSATSMRNFAAEDDFSSFLWGLPGNTPDPIGVFRAVRVGLGLED